MSLWDQRARVGGIPELAWLADVTPEEFAAVAKAVAEDVELQAEIARRVKPYEDGAKIASRMRHAVGLFG